MDQAKKKRDAFVLTSGAHYLQSLNVFQRKSGETMKTAEILQDHMPPLIQKMIPECQQLNILSVGSAQGEKDMIILKIIREELQSSDRGRQVKIYNRAIEPNEYFCGLYKAAIENLPSPLDDQQTAFEICQQTFQDYKESKKEPMKFDIVHFMHSIYYVDIEQTLLHCFEKELSDKGYFVCIVDFDGIMDPVLLKQWPVATINKSARTKPEQLIQIAKENGWKYEVYNQEYFLDVTEVFDPQSAEGNLLLDFMTHNVNFRETADKQLLEETLALIKELTFVKDGKRFGEQKESLVVIYKK